MTNPNQPVRAVAALIALYRQGRLHHVHVMQPHDTQVCTVILQDRVQIRKALKLASGWPPVVPPVIAAFAWLIFSEQNEPRATAFFSALARELESKEPPTIHELARRHDAAYRLAHRLEANARTGVAGRLSRKELLALFFSAWKLWRTGERTRALRVDPVWWELTA
jgi:hypothetical protein